MREQDKKAKTHKPMRKKIWIIAVAVAFLLALSFSLQPATSSRHYEDTGKNEIAAFEMHLKYQTDCEHEENCETDTPPYNFLVFVFDDMGRQVRIVRSDDQGTYKASLPEGVYTLLTSQMFQNIKGLPQEQIELQNGKVLKLNVDYGKQKIMNKKAGEE